MCETLHTADCLNKLISQRFEGWVFFNIQPKNCCLASCKIFFLTVLCMNSNSFLSIFKNKWNLLYKDLFLRRKISRLMYCTFHATVPIPLFHRHDREDGLLPTTCGTGGGADLHTLAQVKVKPDGQCINSPFCVDVQHKLGCVVGELL